MYAQLTTDVQQAVEIIKQGRVVAFPTGTAYGLAVDALQGHALQRLRNLKDRPQEKTFTVFLRENLWNEYLDLTPQEKEALAHFKQKPLTLLVKSKAPLAHLTRDNLIGLRVIDHPIMQQLADAAALPLTATSANRSGHNPCNSSACLAKEFPGKIDDTTYDLSLGCILDGGELPKSPASTIARINEGKIEIIRQGAMDRAALGA